MKISENKTKQKTYYIATLQKHRMVYKNDILAKIIYRLSSMEENNVLSCGMVESDLGSSMYTCNAEEHAYNLPFDPSSMNDWRTRDPLA